MPKKDIEYYFSQVRRISEHREKNAEKEIRKLYKEMLKDIQSFLGGRYAALAEDDKLTYAILQAKTDSARFLAEVEERINSISPKISKEIRAAVEEIYSTAYSGMVEAVQKSANAEQLKNSLKGIKGTTADVIKRAVENPVSGLTLNDTLEKYRKETIYEIKKQIGIGLIEGDRYSTMARRISERLDMDYNKAVRIARTETHRVREAGAQDASATIQEKLKADDSEYRLVKEWKTAKDERVRPNVRRKTKTGWKSGTRRGGANHVKMEGQVVLADELFDLGGGVKAICPGSSGVAGHDINCRCWCKEMLMNDAEFFAATGRHFLRKGKGAGDGDSEEGVAEVVGTVDFNNKTAVLNELDKAQREWENLDHEESLTVTNDGRVWRVKGGKSTVNPWAIQDAGGNLAGSYGYHNHPKKETNYSFSADDVQFFFDAKEMYSKASDNTFEYVLSRTQKTVDIKGSVAYNRFNTVFWEKIMPLAYNGKIDIDLDGYHETMKILSKEYGFSYSRRSRNGNK